MSSKGESFVVATVVKTEGSSLAKPGFKVVVFNDSIIYGTLGGACPESVILDEARKVLDSGSPKNIRIHLEDAGKGLEMMISKQVENEIFVETFCGGTIDVFLEPFKPFERLVIIGQGGRDEVEEYLVLLGRKLDFKVTVIDHAPMLNEKPDELISELDFDMKSYKFSPDDFVVILTKGERDIEALEAVSRHSPAYVGLMASRKRAAHDFETLKGKGISQKFLDSVSTPIGVDIGAITPFEIAISIASEITRRRRERVTSAANAKKVEA
jgi:xanthine dehydrogenase accessory factor